MSASEANWWLDHGLDGIVGGLVGGIVTAGAVWLTLRHERRLAEDTALSDRAGALMAATHRMLEFVGRRESKMGDSRLQERELSVEVFATAYELRGRATRRWPSLALELARACGGLDESMGISRDLGSRRTRDVLDALTRLMSVAGNCLEGRKPDTRRERSKIRGEIEAFTKAVDDEHDRRRQAAEARERQAVVPSDPDARTN